MESENYIGAVWAEGRVSITTVALVWSLQFEFVRVAVVKEQVAKTFVAFRTVEIEERFAVPTEMFDPSAELEAPNRKFVQFGESGVFAFCDVNEPDSVYLRSALVR